MNYPNNTVCHWDYWLKSLNYFPFTTFMIQQSNNLGGPISCCAISESEISSDGDNVPAEVVWEVAHPFTISPHLTVSSVITPIVMLLEVRFRRSRDVVLFTSVNVLICLVTLHVVSLNRLCRYFPKESSITVVNTVSFLTNLAATQCPGISLLLETQTTDVLHAVESLL